MRLFAKPPATVKSARSHAVLDAASRKRKAAKIVQVLEQKLDVKHAKLLDIGTGSGYIAHHLADFVGNVTSIDVIDERKVKSGYSYIRVQDENMPFAPGTFNVVVSNHVIEHVKDQQLHLSEVWRVLKPGGVVYLATPNRNWLIDPHYRVPFINWMPRRLADIYLRALKAKRWDIRPITIRRIRKYVGRHQKLDSIIVDIIKDPEFYHLDTLKSLHPFTKRLPRIVLHKLSHISPTILLTITKT